MQSSERRIVDFSLILKSGDRKMGGSSGLFAHAVLMWLWLKLRSY
jgi:hypothetical protein